MARCWTCGTSVSGYHYRCSYCKDVVREIDSLHETISESFAELAGIQEWGFNQLSNQLSEISTILEWGFGELIWQLQQQTDVLRSIDHTFKTRAETQANEWRLHAEELRRRGVLNESEEFYLKALNEYRLDYRIYVGLAETYLQMNKFDKAKVFLEKSLPHAPKKEIDYKSYSYRLIGHIYACEEDFNQALDALHSSIRLSPNYADGLYDFAQYASLVNDDVVDRICFQTFQEWGGNWALKDYNLVCLLCLQKAIKDKPVYFYLAEKERNFERKRGTVELALKNLLDNARGSVETVLAKINTVSGEVENTISKAKEALNKSRDKAELESSRIYEDVKYKLKLVKEKLDSGDYKAILDAKPIVDEAYNLINTARDKAYKESEHYKKRRAEKVKNAWAGVPATILYTIAGGLFIGPIVGMIGGCTMNAIIDVITKGEAGDLNSLTPGIGIGGIVGLFSGLILGFILGVHRIKKALE